MRRALLALVVALSLVPAWLPSPASATTCTVPNSFTNGTTADATQVNANFTALQSCGNAIDYRNIGSAGIYASQILPDTSAHATFSASGVGWTITTGSTTAVPLTVNAPASTTVDIADFQNNGSNKATISSLGVITHPGSIFSNVTGVPAATNVYIANDGAATNGLQFNVPSGSTSGYTFAVNGVGKASINATGKGGFIGLDVGSAGIDRAGTITLVNSGVGTASSTYVANDGGATAGIQFNVPSGSTAGYTFAVNGVGQASISSAGLGTFKGISAGGAITGATTINASGIITGSQFNGSGAGLTAGSVPIAALAADTISGVALGGNLGTLTIGTHLTGGAYNGSGAVTIATDATNANTASTIVARDAAGAFSAGAITATQFNGSGAGLTSIPNSATTATSANTASAIVARDASGNFSAGAITGATNVYAGSSPNAGVIAGDVSAGTATYGRIVLGGSTSAIDLNYNYNVSNVATLTPLTGTLLGFSVANGWIQGSSNAGTLAYVPPVYNASGAALASTTHVVVGSVAVTTGAGGVNQVAVTFTGAAVFTSATSYSCSGSVDTTNGTSSPTVFISRTSGSAIAVGVVGAPTTAYTAQYSCSGS